MVALATEAISVLVRIKIYIFWTFPSIITTVHSFKQKDSNNDFEKHPILTIHKLLAATFCDINTSQPNEWVLKGISICHQQT